MKVQYRIIAGEYFDGFQKDVNNYILMGWELQGGVCHDGHRFYQAMVFRSND